MDLADKVRALRQEKGLTMAELAELSGVSKPYVTQIERRVRLNPSGAILQKLARALGTTVADLLGTPSGASAEELAEVPASLRTFVRKRGKALDVRREDVEMLKQIHFRGRRPDTREDWELIFLFLRKVLNR